MNAPITEMAQGSTRTKLFGQRAIDLELVTKEQVEAALEEQQKRREAGRTQLLGMVMLNLGILTNSGLLSILKSYESDTGKDIE